MGMIEKSNKLGGAKSNIKINLGQRFLCWENFWQQFREISPPKQHLKQ
jgi:hypothetical protein